MPEQRGYGIVREDFSEHARRPEYSSGLRRDVVEPGLREGDRGVGNLLGSPLRHRANELLQKERVAVSLLDDARHGGLRYRLSEHRSDELLGRSPREAAEQNFLKGQARGELREGIVDVRSRERENHERTLEALVKRRSQIFDARGISPVKIFDRE